MTRRTNWRAAARALPDADDLLALARQGPTMRRQADTANAEHTYCARARADDGADATARHALRVHVERRSDRYEALAQRLASARIAYAMRGVRG